MAATQIAEMRNKHLQMLEWMLKNPTGKLSQLAEHFQVTVPWASVVVRSDCFQQMLREKHDEFFSECLLDINAKLEGLAHKALDKIDQELDLVTGIEAPQQVAQMALKNMGYGQAAPIQARDVYFVDASTLSKAREKIANRTFEGVVAEISSSEGCAVGESDNGDTELRQKAETC